MPAPTPPEPSADRTAAGVDRLIWISGVAAAGRRAFAIGQAKNRKRTIAHSARSPSTQVIFLPSAKARPA